MRLFFWVQYFFDFQLLNIASNDENQVLLEGPIEKDVTTIESWFPYCSYDGGPAIHRSRLDGSNPCAKSTHLTPTPLGQCFTLNGLENGHHIKRPTSIGRDRGLKVAMDKGFKSSMGSRFGSQDVKHALVRLLTWCFRVKAFALLNSTNEDN